MAPMQVLDRPVAVRHAPGARPCGQRQLCAWLRSGATASLASKAAAAVSTRPQATYATYATRPQATYAAATKATMATTPAANAASTWTFWNS